MKGSSKSIKDKNENVNILLVVGAVSYDTLLVHQCGKLWEVEI